jgi:hypothetical protein
VRPDDAPEGEHVIDPPRLTVTLVMPPDDALETIILPFTARVSDALAVVREWLEPDTSCHIALSDEDEPADELELLSELATFDAENGSIDLWVRAGF